MKSEKLFSFKASGGDIPNNRKDQHLFSLDFPGRDAFSLFGQTFYQPKVPAQTDSSHSHRTRSGE